MTVPPVEHGDPENARVPVNGNRPFMSATEAWSNVAVIVVVVLPEAKLAIQVPLTGGTNVAVMAPWSPPAQPPVIE
jgi:hypothetical protein